MLWNDLLTQNCLLFFRHGLESNVLRFMARLNTTRPIDMDRRFIISYFLSDDTILVYEPQQRNSGILGGKFLERRRIKRGNQDYYYSAQVCNKVNEWEWNKKCE